MPVPKVLFGSTLRNIHEYYPYGLEYWRSGSKLYDRGDQYSEFHHREWEMDGIEMNRFAARWYDPAIARWHAPDPLEQMHSPYVALCGDPANFVDPDGRAGIHLSDWDKQNILGFAGVLAGGAAMVGIGHALNGLSAVSQAFQAIRGPLSFKSSISSGVSLLQNISSFAGKFERNVIASSSAANSQMTKNSKRPEGHIENASLYITNTEIYVAGKRQSIGTSKTDGSRMTYVAGENIWRGELSLRKVSIVKNVVHFINDNPNCVPTITTTRSEEALKVMEKEPWSLKTIGTLTSSFNSSYFENEIERFIRSDLSDDAGLFEVGTSEMIEIKVVFRTANDMNSRKLGELKEQFVSMRKKFRDTYGVTLKVNMEILENSLDKGFRMDIESTRKIYSIDPEDKYSPIYEKASPYSD